jgi:hypothetical protein
MKFQSLDKKFNHKLNKGSNQSIDEGHSQKDSSPRCNQNLVAPWTRAITKRTQVHNSTKVWSQVKGGCNRKDQVHGTTWIQSQAG